MKKKVYIPIINCEFAGKAFISVIKAKAYIRKYWCEDAEFEKPGKRFINTQSEDTWIDIMELVK